MRRFIISLICALCVSCAYALDKKDAVKMVSYEQGWLDSQGTLALKNNTDEEIHNVVFQITYLDMSGNSLDYEEFSRKVSIAPGMTRKLDIPAYEHCRNYHYYKSENMPGGSPSFKISFELKDYNVTETTEEIADDDLYSFDRDTTEPSPTFYIVMLLVGLFIIGAWIGLYILVAVMAKKRNRNVALWVLLSIIASPLLIVIILLAVGDDNSRIDNYER